MTNDLTQLMAAFPRVPLGRFPTPLEPMPRLTQALGGPSVWIKRDDAVGPAMGGNKTRKLEFLFGQARAQNAAAVATFGGLQSNFARQMVGAARSLGLEPHCFYFVARPRSLEGNLLLNALMGARLHFIPFGQSDEPSMTLEQATQLVRWVVRLTPSCWGKRLYFMPVGGHTALACLGYVLAAMELEEQLRERGVEKAVILTASGTGGTLAGLMAGFHLLGSRHTALGIDVGKLWRGFPASIAALASQICALLGAPHTFDPNGIPLIERTYVGPAYAKPTAESLEAARLAARNEGVILDPVYSSKAMAGLIDLVKQRRWGEGMHVVFLHTGGMPALWAKL
jgi:1-aminocyclopropane-1-carboxylate deaminase/D-cysteine desulfhydrase-like pyridoxal-dependent ACC family enzyme